MSDATCRKGGRLRGQGRGSHMTLFREDPTNLTHNRNAPPLASSHTNMPRSKTPQEQTNMVFYMQDWESGANTTAIMVAGNTKRRWHILEFGTIFATDDALTESIDRNSTQVGRAHGIYVNSALGGSDLHLLMSLEFTNKEYNGRTLEIQGADRFLHKYREVSVVSGTGKFRFARGYATLETVYLNIPGSNAIIRWNVTFLHY